MSALLGRREGALKQPHQAPLPSGPPWLKRLGAGGFLFFLIKGLLWMLAPAFLAIAGLE